MKDFIEKLKEHGYEVVDHPDDNGVMVTHDMLDYWTGFTVDGKEDKPWLMLFCLDEIERSGWFWGFNVTQYGGGICYELLVQKEDGMRLNPDGKTKTEACMNALMAVLEAS